MLLVDIVADNWITMTSGIIVYQPMKLLPIATVESVIMVNNIYLGI